MWRSCHVRARLNPPPEWMLDTVGNSVGPRLSEEDDWLLFKGRRFYKYRVWRSILTFEASERGETASAQMREPPRDPAPTALHLDHGGLRRDVDRLQRFSLIGVAASTLTLPTSSPYDELG